MLLCALYSLSRRYLFLTSSVKMMHHMHYAESIFFASTKGMSDLHSLCLLFEVSLYYVILCQAHIWLNRLQYLQEPQRVRLSRVFSNCCLYLISLSRLSTNDRFPYKWWFCLCHLIVAVLRAVDQTRRAITIRCFN